MGFGRWVPVKQTPVQEKRINRHVSQHASLMKILRDMWNNISQDRIRALYDSVPTDIAKNCRTDARSFQERRHETRR